MSETNETSGRCRQEVDDRYGSPCELVIADAIDRLAADVAAIKEAVVSPKIGSEQLASASDIERLEQHVQLRREERDEARKERDEARASVERLKKTREAAIRLYGATLAEVERLRSELYDREQELLSLRADTVERYEPPAATQPAADVAAVKEAVCGNSPKTSDSSPAAPQPEPFSDAQPAMDKDRAVVQRYCEAEQQADTPPAASQPAQVSDAQPAAWGVRRADGVWVGIRQSACQAALILKSLDAAVNSVHEAVALYAAPQPAAPPAGWLTERERHVLSSMLSERPCDWSLHWSDDVQPVFRSILARAGSPPVVEVPAIDEWDAPARVEALAYRAALDKAGVPWKEVPRE